jgi:hypothetical protein
MKKKLGPLPVWGWLLISAGVVAFMWYRSRQSSSSSSNLSQVDPNNPLGLTYAQENADLASGIDPNTGQTYAGEQAAAAGSLQGSGGAGATDQTNPIQTATGELGSLLKFVTVLTSFEKGLASQFSHPPPTTPDKIHVKKGGRFYKWYLKTFGSPPPALISANNPAYLLFKRLQREGALGGKDKDHGGHNGSGSAGHPGGHIDPDHKIQRHTHHRHSGNGSGSHEHDPGHARKVPGHQRRGR